MFNRFNIFSRFNKFNKMSAFDKYFCKFEGESGVYYCTKNREPNFPYNVHQSGFGIKVVEVPSTATTEDTRKIIGTALTPTEINIVRIPNIKDITNNTLYCYSGNGNIYGCRSDPSIADKLGYHTMVVNVCKLMPAFAIRYKIREQFAKGDHIIIQDE